MVNNLVVDFTVFTCDQELYCVAVEVQWAYPDKFSNVVRCLRRMHMLMRFVGSIGYLVVESGLADIIDVTFEGVTKMLNAKKFPQNVKGIANSC